MNGALAAAVLILMPALSHAERPAPNVRIVEDEATRRSCRYLGLVSVRQAMGTNKAGGALKKAMRKVEAMGGNGLFLINQSQNLFDGASVSGEALLCPELSSLPAGAFALTEPS